MDKEIPHLKKIISECEEEIQELSKNGKNFPVSSENKVNTNSPTRELNDKTLLQYFQERNIKSIKLENNKLVIEYNSKQEKEIKEANSQELKNIKSFAEKLGKNELNLSDLEQSNNLSNSLDKSYKGFYIGLIIGGVLIVGFVV